MVSVRNRSSEKASTLKDARTDPMIMACRRLDGVETHPLRQVAHGAACEAVPRPRGILHRLQRKRRGGEPLALRAEQRAVLPPLDDQDARSPRLDGARRADQVGLVGQLSGLGVVDDQCVHQLQGVPQGIPLPRDPIVHGIRGHQRRPTDLPEDIALQVRVDVGQEHHLRVSVILWDLSARSQRRR